MLNRQVDIGRKNWGSSVNIYFINMDLDLCGLINVLVTPIYLFDRKMQEWLGKYSRCDTYKCFKYMLSTEKYLNIDMSFL